MELTTVLFALLGLSLLGAGGDLLVRGAVGIAEVLKVSPLFTGLVLVGFGTSMPELESFSGSSSRMALSVCTPVSRLKGFFAATISYRTHPRAKMSDRWSARWPRTCSGAM